MIASMPTSTSRAEDSVSPPHSGSKAIRVLVADDNAVYRGGVIRAIHRDPRLELVGEAMDGDQAIELIQALRPDVAILDLSMPGSGGLQVAQALADDDARLPTQLVLLTAMLEPPIEARARTLGFSAALSKDLTRREILDAVVELMEDRSGR
jgi:two-component system nitrate/nitrite response regulator NarL